ncbi:universal stress protein [Sphaerotilus natans]|uniref:universal stress protein n=1 Tax=Sphaerotilus natans TaxID=34103 RepID=UPI00406C6E49
MSDDSVPAHAGPILVATDFSVPARHAAERAARLAHETVSPLVLLTVLMQSSRAAMAITLTATQLALFHTLFNLLGVLLMWPLADRMTRALMQRWRIWTRPSTGSSSACADRP